MNLLEALGAHIASASMAERYGVVVSFNGLVIEAHGPEARVGEVCEIALKSRVVLAQVVGIRDRHLLLMPYGDVEGLTVGATVRASGRDLDVPVDDTLLGRVVDAFCAPLDGGGPLNPGGRYPLHAPAINPLHRADIDSAIATGVRAIDGLLTLGRGQRVGIFAGSGVGKSTLIGMLAAQVEADVVLIAMIGERGREVGEFVRHTLGPEIMRRCVVMVATSDQPALVRIHAVHAAHAVAEYFRDQGRSVLLVLDSITRFAMAQREVGLASGEPPTFRGYTPSVFAWLPRILERCGKLEHGSITAIYSVLVEGDDLNEPVTDHMRAILDGHIVLDRELAARGHYPAINVLKSVSRLVGRLLSQDELEVASNARRTLALLEGARDMVDMGAYQSGVNPELDRALVIQPALEAWLRQSGRFEVSGSKPLESLKSVLQDVTHHG
ncbi:MAG TPA: FliI/YscN family ATPase [Stenotrophomonas sp.]|nr:FliI/YscN family ATPase [Stenotrophomonas sp.]